MRLRLVTPVAALFVIAATAMLQAQSSNTLLAQMASAFAGTQVVQQVQLSGTATWYAGSLTDSGSVAMTGNSDGSSTMQIQLATLGTKTESKTGIGTNAVCTWEGNDGTAHPVDVRSCWKPEVWFAPILTLQPTSLLPALQTADLGIGNVGNSDSTYRHLRSQFLFSALNANLEPLIQQKSTMDLGIDPSSLLPVVLTYSLRADGSSITPVQVEVLYSEYRSISGVQIPYHIQRFINGSLQLDISITSAQIN